MNDKTQTIFRVVKDADHPFAMIIALSRTTELPGTPSAQDLQNAVEKLV